MLIYWFDKCIATQILFSYQLDLSSDRCLCFIVFRQFWLLNFCKDNFSISRKNYCIEHRPICANIFHGYRINYSSLKVNKMSRGGGGGRVCLIFFSIISLGIRYYDIIITLPWLGLSQVSLRVARNKYLVSLAFGPLSVHSVCAEWNSPFTQCQLCIIPRWQETSGQTSPR